MYDREREDMIKLFSDTNDGEGDRFDIADGDINAAQDLMNDYDQLNEYDEENEALMENRVQYPQFTGDYMDNYDGDDGDRPTNNRTAYRIVICLCKIIYLVNI
jgi:hypothetical protein